MTFIEAFVSGVKEVYRIISELAGLYKRNPRFFIASVVLFFLVVAVGAAYQVLVWYVYTRPANTIYEFYNDINQKNGDTGIERAWKLLAPNFVQSKHQQYWIYFRDGFKVTQYHTHVTASHIGSKRDPFAALFGDLDPVCSNLPVPR